MSRVLGEISALVFAMLVSCAALAPALTVVAAGVRPDAEASAFLVLGMVYGMVAPIGYFLAERWQRRIGHVLGAALAAAALARTGYLFEIREPRAALATLALLAAGLAAAFAWSRAVARRRAAQLAEIEDEAAETVSAVARGAGSGAAARLAERLAAAAVWTAVREAESADDARRRIGRALAALEYDLKTNPAIETAAHVARLVGEMRARIAPLRFRPRAAAHLPLPA